MKISVIVPCFNAERWLPECVASLRGQTMDDFEALFVDDGSRDGTAGLLREAARADARLRVFRQENRGVSAARNLALGQARGDWLFFLDADDVLPREALGTLLSAAGEDCDLVIGRHTVFSEQGEEAVRPEGGWPALSGEARRRAAALRLIEGDSVLNIMCNKLHRRAFAKARGLRLCEDVRVAEDNLFNLEAVLTGRGIADVPRVTYRYRMHGGSAMHRQSGPQFEMHLPWLRALRALLLRLGRMEAYYGAYLDSVTLRLYKDGGVPNVLRQWREKALPLAAVPGLEAGRMSPRDGRLYHLVMSGRYPFVYPFEAARQILGRKAGGLKRRGAG